MLLRVTDLSYSYPEAPSAAVQSALFSLDSGEYLAVLGSNGSGKSTLARCIAGLLKPSVGSAVFDAPAGKVPCALVFQSPADQLVGETAELDAAFGLENLGTDQSEMVRRVRGALSLFALDTVADLPVGELSCGLKQHAALAGAMVLDPALLLLDEPTSMLSPAARASLLSFLDRFHGEGGSIMHITHDLEEAARAERILILDDGRTVFDGPSSAFAAIPRSSLEAWGLASPAVPQAAVPEVPAPASPALSPALSAAPETAAAPSPLLSCAHLSLGPLSGISLDLYPGTVTAVTGESGSGKSLLLSVLAGLAEPAEGSRTLAPGCRAALAVQESEASLFAEFAADDVAFGPRNSGVSGKELVSRVRRAMDLCGLPFDRFAERHTFSLSGGERRKAALAGIVAMDSDIVLLDEPSSALDVRSRAQLFSLIGSLRAEGKAVAFTTNRREECAWADQTIELPDPPPRTADPAGYKSALCRTSPLTRYLLTLSQVFAAVFIQGPLFLAALLFLEFIPLRASRYPLKKLILGIARILPWLALIVALQFLLQPNVYHSAMFLLRFITLYIPLSVFMHLCSHTEIMYGMEDLLKPLSFLGVPARSASLLVAVVFRFVVILKDEADRIVLARKMRGGDRKKRGISGKIASVASLFVPLVLRTLVRADRLAQAIEARGFGTGKNSRYLLWKRDVRALILNVMAPVLAIILVWLSTFVRM